MSVFFAQIRQMIILGRGGEYGPLPPLLVAMTVVTGLVDAFSYLVLGHVFVANMTGNVVFLGFALAGAAGFSVSASLSAIGAFCLGALAGGRLGTSLHAHRGRLLSMASAAEAFLVGGSVAIAATVSNPGSSGTRYVLIVLLGLAMGMPNSVAPKLAGAGFNPTALIPLVTRIFPGRKRAG